MKTRPIGEIFNDSGTSLEVVEIDEHQVCDGCDGCFYDMGMCGCVAGDNAGCCTVSNRTDGKNVIFKEIKEVEE